MKSIFVRELRLALVVAGATVGLGACSGILDVEFPGRIPAGQVNDPTLAAVLARSVVSDLECAYNNYMAGSSVHSDEYETANSNVPLANWGERGINADEDDYVIGACESDLSNFGMHTPLQTARFQAEDVFARLSGWTDAQVAGRQSLMAQVKTSGAYAITFMGETFCSVAFDGGAAQTPGATLAQAETKFTEAIQLATTAANTDVLNLARVGLARVQLDLKKYAAAAATAALVPADYVKLADRGTESTRRHNKLFLLSTSLGAFTVDTSFRNSGDPRMPVANANKGSFNPTVPLWITNKYANLGSPLVLASGKEARLIRAEGLAETGDIPGAMAILNAGRATAGLAPLTATTTAQAVAAVLSERRVLLAFEGGHRLNDILRRQIPWKGAFGSTRTVNQWTSRGYGATTCWPNPTKETNGA